MGLLSPRIYLFLLFVSPSMLACTESEPSPEQGGQKATEAPAGAPTESPPKGPAPPAQGAKSSTKGEAAKTEGANAACLAGKWHYDFADDALETMMSNLPNSKVTKEEGELICENTLLGVEGTVTCSAAGGKPVHIEIAADQAGMPLTVSVKILGKSSSKFKLVDDKTMQVTSEGIGDLKVEVEATIAGNKIPFPVAPLLQSFTGKMGATNAFECQGDTLRLRPQIDAKTSWQELKRLK